MSRRAPTVLATAIGLALLTWQVEKIGVAAILEGVRNMGASGLALILLVSLGRQMARAAAWVLLMRDGDRHPGDPGGQRHRPPLSAALAATMSGDAIGNLTPFSLLVSEPAKALYVREHVPPERALAALAAENFFYSLSVAVTVLAGVAVLFLAYPVPDWLRTASLVLVASMAAVLVAALWLIAKEPALVSATLTRVFGLVGATAPTTLVDKIRTLETSSYAFVRARPGRLVSVIACEASFHVLSVAETWITLVFLGHHSFALAFVLDTVQRVINVIFRVVPLKIGVDEVGSGLTSAALGYGGALGVTMGVIRKLRVLAWALIGLALLGRRGRM